jgi:hypothetical protein
MNQLAIDQLNISHEQRDLLPRLRRVRRDHAAAEREAKCRQLPHIVFEKANTQMACPDKRGVLLALPLSYAARYHNDMQFICIRFPFRFGAVAEQSCTVVTMIRTVEGVLGDDGVVTVESVSLPSPRRALVHDSTSSRQLFRMKRAVEEVLAED